MFLKNIVNKAKSIVDETEEIDNQFFAEVMKEIEDGFKDKGIEGKSIAMSGGNEKKADSLYIQMRAQTLQNDAIIKNEELRREIKRINEESRREIKRIAENNKLLEQERHDIKVSLGKDFAKILGNSDSIYKLYKDELQKEGFTKASMFSITYLKRDGKGFNFLVKPEDKMLFIVNSDDEVVMTYDLKEKESLILGKK